MRVVSAARPQRAKPVIDTGIPARVRPDAFEGTVAAVRGASGASAPPAFARLQVPGAPADVLLPAVTSPYATSPLQLYASRLERTNAFPEQRAALRALGRVRTEWAPLEPPGERPRVAILISEPQALLPGGYEPVARLADMLREQGCDPVLIPPMSDVLIGTDRAHVQATLTKLVDGLDGVVGPGGADVHPRLYRDAVTHAITPNFPRDRFEAELATLAMQGDRFLLGICRSHQLWNAALGGKLVQDVRADGLSVISQNQDDYGLEEHEPFVVRDAAGKVTFENRVHLTPDSQFSAIVGGAESVLTNSYHHQAVGRPGQGLTVTGVVTDPETQVETVESTEAWNVLTTQFHPELMMDADPRFAALTETVARRAHVFRLKKTLAAEGKSSCGDLVAAMREAPEGRFLPTDLAWVEQTLGPRQNQ